MVNMTNLTEKEKMVYSAIIIGSEGYCESFKEYEESENDMLVNMDDICSRTGLNENEFNESLLNAIKVFPQ